MTTFTQRTSTRLNHRFHIDVGNLAKVCDELGLPHPMHLHGNNLEFPATSPRRSKP